MYIDLTINLGRVADRFCQIMAVRVFVVSILKQVIL